MEATRRHQLEEDIRNAVARDEVLKRKEAELECLNRLALEAEEEARKRLEVMEATRKAEADARLKKKKARANFELIAKLQESEEAGRSPPSSPLPLVPEEALSPRPSPVSMVTSLPDIPASMHGARVDEKSKNAFSEKIKTKLESEEASKGTLRLDDAPVLAAEDEIPEVLLPRGSKVIIEGLQGRKDLNGKKGRIIGWLPSKARYSVKLNSGAAHALRPRNCTRQTAPSKAVKKTSLEERGLGRILDGADEVLSKELLAIKEAEANIMKLNESKRKEAMEQLDMRGKEIQEMQKSVEDAKAGEDRERAIWGANRIKEAGIDGAREVIARAPFGYMVVDEGQGHLERTLAACAILIRKGGAKVQSLMEEYGRGGKPSLSDAIEAQLAELDRLEGGVKAVEVHLETLTEKSKEAERRKREREAYDGAMQASRTREDSKRRSAEEREPPKQMLEGPGKSFRGNRMDYARWDQLGAEEEAEEARQEVAASEAKRRAREGVMRSGSVPARMEYIQSLVGRVEARQDGSKVAANGMSPEEMAALQSQMKSKMEAAVGQAKRTAEIQENVTAEARLEAILYELYKSHGASNGQMSAQERQVFKEQARLLYEKTKDVEVEEMDVDLLVRQTMAGVGA